MKVKIKTLEKLVNEDEAMYLLSCQFRLCGKVADANITPLELYIIDGLKWHPDWIEEVISA